jgi:hypothetical protein
MSQPESLPDQPTGERWACPTCGWTITSSVPRAEAEAQVADGWWWCQDGHARAALVPAVSHESDETQPNGEDR